MSDDLQQFVDDAKQRHADFKDVIRTKSDWTDEEQERVDDALAGGGNPAEIMYQIANEQMDPMDRAFGLDDLPPAPPIESINGSLNELTADSGIQLDDVMPE